MAGSAKPSVVNLGSEVFPTIIASNTEWGGAQGLFDGITSAGSSSVCYWWKNTESIELLIPNECNIWRCGSSYVGTQYCNPLTILKYNGSTYDDVTSLYPQTVTFINYTQWEKTINNLKPGQYKFVGLPGGNKARADSEWYLEAINKFLIKQNDQYYSVKDSKLTLLGIPTDDTQKEEWFNDYGVDDLKEALLTPNENGNKLVDSLNNQFEIRIMKAK